MSTDGNEIKDLVAELKQVRITIAGLNLDPELTIAAYRAEKETALLATKNLAASTARLMWATWALVGVTILLAIAALSPVVAMVRAQPDGWVLYKYGGGVLGTFKTLADCQVASKRQSGMSSECYPRGVSPQR